MHTLVELECAQCARTVAPLQQEVLGRLAHGQGEENGHQGNGRRDGEQQHQVLAEEHAQQQAQAQNHALETNKK